MKRWPGKALGRVGLLLSSMSLMALMSGCALLGAQANEQALQPAAHDPMLAAGLKGDQILVMIKEVPIKHLRLDEDYGASYRPGQATGPSTRTMLALSREFQLTAVDHWPMPALAVHCYLLVLRPGVTAEDVIDRLAADPRVESAEPVQRYRTLGHNDAYYGLQTSAGQLQLDALHQMATGRGVRVAQIDSGVDQAHPDLIGQIVDAPDLVDARAEITFKGAEAHGTEVAGIMVAKADNGVGIVGVAPHAQLLALRACWQTAANDDAATCSSFTLAKALQYALSHHVQVLNMSLSGPPDTLLTRLLMQAQAQGISIVSAVDPAARPGLGFPAGLPGVIAVSAGPGPAGLMPPEHAVLAPGLRVLTTTPHGSWGFVTGNSFAAAHVSGVIALLLEASPGLSPTELARLVQSHPQRQVSGTAWPALDACRMLAEQRQVPGCPCCNVPTHVKAAASATGS